MPATTVKNGQFYETSFFDNVGGLNNTDSPFKVSDDQSTGGYNYEYTQTGGIQKRRGPELINDVADTELVSRGLEIFNTADGDKTPIRAAGRKIQSVDLSGELFTNLEQDNATSTTDVFPANTTTPTVFAQFNTDTISMLNFAGNTDGIYSIVSTTEFTKNGSVAPTGSLAVSSTLSTGGSWTVTGNVVYSISWHKNSTGAESNAALNLTVGITTTLQTNVINLASVTSVDQTTYDYGILWRSAFDGVSDFTSGDYVTTFASNATTVSDTGSSILSSQNVPRPNSLVLDNSTLPTGTYNVITLWKRRLVTATDNILRFSDLNVPESWPTVNTITIPSGGPITGLAVISFNTDFGNDEYLAVFQERQVWLVRGNDYSDVTLSFIDSVGCASQSLITLANGYLAWVDYRGIYLWDGAGKPIYCSRPIEALFQIDGDLDKTKLSLGWASFLRSKNQIIWYVSDKIRGEQMIALKLDLRLTMPSIGASLAGRVLDGVFTVDSNSQAFYAVKTFLPASSNEEMILLGDNEGYLYSGFKVFNDAGDSIDYSYPTRFLDMGNPNVNKRYFKVIAWVEDLGDWDLALDYWTQYRVGSSEKSVLTSPISTIPGGAQSLWDVALWDVAFWDEFSARKMSAVVFNLNNDQGNSEGDCIRLQFRQEGIDQPITIYGYTIIWSDKGMAK